MDSLGRCLTGAGALIEMKDESLALTVLRPIYEIRHAEATRPAIEPKDDEEKLPPPVRSWRGGGSGASTYERGRNRARQSA